MSNYAGLGDLVEQIREASTNIRTRDEKNDRRLEAIEALVNELYRKTSRPGAVGGSGSDDDVVERESAIGMCEIRLALTVPKVDGVQTTEYAPSQSEIDAGCAPRLHGDAAQRRCRPARLQRAEVALSLQLRQ